MHWIRTNREALYDASELAKARKRRGLGGYVSDSPRQSMWKPQRNFAPRPEGICASCRQPAELEEGKAWCNDCRRRQSQINRGVREAERKAKDPAYTRYVGPCAVCGQRMETERKRGKPRGVLVHRKCLPLYEAAQERAA